MSLLPFIKNSEHESIVNGIREQFDSLNETYEVVKNEVISLTEKLATVESEFARVNDENESFKAQLRESEETILEVAVEATEIDAIASNKALEIVAGLGVDPIATGDEEPAQTITEKFYSIKDKKEQDKFYSENRAAILAALSR